MSKGVTRRGELSFPVLPGCHALVLERLLADARMAGLRACDPGDLPVSCTWNDGACGGGGCAAETRRQYETCTPPGCGAPQSRCVSDGACACTCGWGSWVAGAGCGGTCGCNEFLREWTCSSPSCPGHGDQICQYRSICDGNC